MSAAVPSQPPPRRHHRTFDGSGASLADGLPKPTMSGGLPYTAQMDVRHGEAKGCIQWVDWRHPNGALMPADSRKQGKKLRPGAWFAVVSWIAGEHAGRGTTMRLDRLEQLCTDSASSPACGATSAGA